MNRRNKWTTWLLCATLLLALSATTLQPASANASGAQTGTGRKKHRKKQPQYNPYKGMGDVQGTIAAISGTDVITGAIDEKLGDNSVRHFTTIGSTIVTFNGIPGKFSDLRPGMAVDVIFLLSNKNIATKINAFPTLGR